MANTGHDYFGGCFHIVNQNTGIPKFTIMMVGEAADSFACAVGDRVLGFCEAIPFGARIALSVTAGLTVTIVGGLLLAVWKLVIFGTLKV